MKSCASSSVIARSVGTFAVVWLSVGTAWAGAGGPDLGSLQSVVDDLCSALKMSSCPQLPTTTQLVLEFAGLGNAPPEVARAINTIAPTAGISAVNPPAGSPFVPAHVAPLAFISPATLEAEATVTQPGDPSANSFFYAATNGT